MDDPSLLPIVNNNGNGHHYSDEAMISDNDIEHEEDEYEDDEIVNGDEHVDEEDNDNNEDDEENPTYPEDEIDDDDEVDEEEIDEREIQIQNDSMRQASPTEETAPAAPQPASTSTNEQINQSERGGRRKGVPRRLQIIPQIENPFQIQQRPSTTTTTNKNSPLINQQIAQDEHIEQEEDLSHFDNRFSSDYFAEHLNGLRSDDYDENNNHQYFDDENPLEIIDDILAEIVTKVVHEIRQQRRCNNKETQRLFAQKVNGHSQFKTNLNGPKKHQEKVEQKINHSKHSIDHLHSNSIKSSKSQSQQSMRLSSSIKMSDSSTLLNELTKMMQSNGSGSHSSGSTNKQKHSLSPSPSSFSTPSSAKRTKLSDTSFPSSTSPNSLSIQQQQHQQLLLQMTQQFLMSTQGADFDGSSILKQQLLGHTASVAIPAKRPGRPPKQASQPQVMRSSTNMLPSSANSSPSSFERTGFAPRRRGRPPKYVTERSVGHLSPHDIDPASYEQLLAAIENSGNGAGRAAATSAAINTALASLIGHQSGLNLSNSMTQAAAVRNGTPASLMKQSAGQNRQTVPSSTPLTKPGKVHSPISNPLDLALMVPKKRGPGRPPKNQSLIDSHQILQATKRTNSSLSSSNNFPPTMVPSSPSSFSFNPALVEMFHAQQQQQHQKHQH